ncbi:hypothetical protein BROUX41_006730 [Berkeleyomyces rouxiae]|uniref:uncharacterized protein n=1 Tax=Berkeleyomyces rouxiae TaxID=2035830 RepID=UPI003B7AF913
MLFKTFSTLALVVSSVLAVPVADTSSVPHLEARNVNTKGHDQIVALGELVPDDNVGKAYRQFQPFLRIDSGCFPYPAVDSDGNIGGGLKKGGSPEGKCRGSEGQLYVRSTWYKGYYAIMYAWYMPKDQGTGRLALIGHRHEWENAIVWIDNMDSYEPKILGISASKHSTYNKYNARPAANIFPQGNDRPQIKYYRDVAFFGTHATNIDDAGKDGKEQVMVQWEMLPPAAREALENASFGDANCPIKDGRFLGQLEKAFPW